MQRFWFIYNTHGTLIYKCDAIEVMKKYYYNNTDIIGKIVYQNNIKRSWRYMLKFKVYRFIANVLPFKYINNICFYYAHKGHPEWINQSLLEQQYKPKIFKRKGVI